jgi:hypothetical protein
MNPKYALVFFNRIMKMDMTVYNIYIVLIVIIKLLFGILTLVHLYFFITGNTESAVDKKILFWTSRIEFIFIAMLSGLLIYVFNPSSPKELKIDMETRLLIYVLGFVLLLTADWGIFIRESPLLKKVAQKQNSNT